MSAKLWFTELLNWKVCTFSVVNGIVTKFPRNNIATFLTSNVDPEIAECLIP